ncbi:protein kinase family protein [Spirillospora sp. CA-294931]|uniref:protein kinase family protein n=1 Tax=Spirillospora sp. CA-294931 TaxID=3240042 RepID=UPI003D8C85F7
MSTSVIEPGTRLAGRYRLEERISDSGGSSLWKAIDEILARAVAVRTFEPGFPRVSEVVTSARAASRLTDPRVTQVFDADDTGESAYVVSEWVQGETLEQMLGKQPLEPGRATTLLYEASEAVTAAHNAGLSHLCLSPRDLVWTTGGTVKLLGVATDAVLNDAGADDTAAQDVRGLGAMLYAALTAHWPGDPKRSGLPAAPTGDDGSLQGPRQIRPGISYAVDAIVCRALGITQHDPLTTPAEFSTALRGVPRTPLPLFAGLGSPPPAPPRPAPQQPQQRPAAAPQRRPQEQQQTVRHQTTVDTAPAAPTKPRGGGNRALLGVAAAALTVIVGLGAWALASDEDDPKGSGKSGVTDPGNKPKPTKPLVGRLKVQNVIAAEDPRGNHPDAAIQNNLQALTDGRTAGRTWSTQSYNDTDFGRLTKGLGAVLDLGRPMKLSNVKVFSPEGGGIIQIKIGDTSSHAAMRPVESQSTVTGETTINITSQARGRYVLVWYTKLPMSRKGKLSEIAVYGSPG